MARVPLTYVPLRSTNNRLPVTWSVSGMGHADVINEFKAVSNAFQRSEKQAGKGNHGGEKKVQRKAKSSCRKHLAALFGNSVFSRQPVYETCVAESGRRLPTPDSEYGKFPPSRSCYCDDLKLIPLRLGMISHVIRTLMLSNIRSILPSDMKLYHSGSTLTMSVCDDVLQYEVAKQEVHTLWVQGRSRTLLYFLPRCCN